MSFEIKQNLSSRHWLFTVLFIAYPFLGYYCCSCCYNFKYLACSSVISICILNINILRYSLFGIAGGQEEHHTFVKLSRLLWFKPNNNFTVFF